MEFWRYYRIIRRRRWLIILGMLICVGAVAANNYMSVPMYTGRTTLMETRGMSQQGIPLYAEMPYMQMDEQLRLSNLGSIATSNKVMRDAADSLADLGLSYDPATILSNTKVAPVKDTNILAVEVILPDPANAKQAADVVAMAFRNAYDDINNAAVRQSREFIEAQLQATKLAMVKAQNALRNYKERNEIVQLDMQGQAAIQRISQVKSELAASQAAYDAADAGVKHLEGELKELPEWNIVSRQINRDPVWQDLTTQRNSLEAQKAGMLNGTGDQQRRGPNHPQVLEIQGRIDDVVNKLKNVQEEYVSSIGKSLNQTRLAAVNQCIGIRVERVSAEAKKNAMQEVVGQVRQEMRAMPAKEAKLAELTADVQAASQTYSLMRNKLDEARIKEQQAKDERALKVIDAAYVTVVNQKQMMKLVFALILSPLLGIGVAFLLHYADNSVKNAADAEKLLGLPVHAVVPGARAHSLPRQKCPEIIDVAYQMLTSNLWIASQNQGINSLVVVSAEPDVGRSVTASNLAVALSKEGARVVLVDTDFRQPTQHLIFGVDNKVGLTNLLSGGATLEDVLLPTKVQNLLLVPTGPVPGNPVKLLKSPEMKEFVDQTRSIADFVIYDTPAGVAFPDPVIVSTQVGSAIVVHAAGRVPRGSEADLRSRLESVGVRLLGAVLNKVKREDSSGYFHYHRSYEGVTVGAMSGRKKALKGGGSDGTS